MGYIPPPAALFPGEFNERIKYLREKGLPLTMRNIDPKFYKHFETCRKSRLYSMVCGLLLSIIFLMILFGYYS